MFKTSNPKPQTSNPKPPNLKLETKKILKKHKYIAIEGNIGSGKTTLALKLAQTISAELLLEEFEDNKSLKEFYASQTDEEKSRIAFAAELQFILDRYTQQKQHFNTVTKAYTISDYVPSKCLLFAQMNLSESQYENITQTYHHLMETLPSPDLLIYLKKDIPSLLSNIATRGREYEKGITQEYLLKIEKGYVQLLNNFSRNTKIIILNDEQTADENSCVELIKKIIFLLSS